jgi:predicted RNA-binding Zn-ribbon protein involved in translation (DUF1610 family)
MPHCQNCGEHVSDRFQRVFGIKDGQVYACPKCSPNAGIGEVNLRRFETD